MKRTGNQNSRSRRRNAAFSLVELLVVLVIIAVLASAAGFALVNAADDARVTATKQEMATVAGALKTYRARNGEYPADGAGGLQTLVTTGLLEQGAIEDSWGNPLDFGAGHEGFQFVIYSAGIDKLWDTDDDILWTDEGDYDDLMTADAAP